MPVTPKVYAGFPKFLYVKDTEGKYASNKYKLEIRMPKGDAEVEAFVKMILRAHEDAGGNSYAPVKDGDAYAGDNDKRRDYTRGHYTMTFKTDRQPKVVDSQKQAVEGKIDGGDIIKVAYGAKPYDAFGGGLALYLNAVQLLEKRGGGGVDEFGTEDGFKETMRVPEFDTTSDGDF